LEEAAEGWLAAFNEHESGALTDLVNFVLRSAGCDLEVSIEDIEDPDNCAGRLSDLQDEFQAVCCSGLHHAMSLLIAL
jgi:cohesin complex subunit SA-1/2